MSAISLCNHAPPRDCGEPQSHCARVIVYLLTAFNRSQTCWLDSACVIRPTSTKEVIKAIKIVAFLRVEFAVRSGGHSPNPGWAGVGGSGILIDLGSINQISISADHQTVSIGPGARWGDAVSFLDPYGVTVLAGRVPTVGVGGLVLGG